ncbi:MAG: hypothetical protein GY771_00675, partial [bacterium]|nr:hypothetical protein [bacterium]
SGQRVACLNEHTGELAPYRGMAAVFRMLYEGKGYTAPTIRIMNEKLDDGPIVASERCDIADNDTLYTATVKTKYCAARLLVDVLSHYSESNVKLKPNDKGEAKIYRFPGKKAAKEFKKRGRRLI